MESISFLLMASSPHHRFPFPSLSLPLTLLSPSPLPADGIPYSTTDDLCADQAGTSDPCPLAVGQHTDFSTSQFPSFSGKLVSGIQWVDQNGAQIFCAQITFRA